MTAEHGRATLRDKLFRVFGWVIMFLLGPLHFLGEMVGPLGGTDWRQWVCAIGGTYLWMAAIWWVVQHV